MTSTVLVLADLRFAADTGIGKVQSAMVNHRPPWADVVDLQVPGRYGHPLSPVRIARSLRDAPSSPAAVFWSCGFIPPLYSRVPVAITVHDLTHLTHYGAGKRLYFSSVLRPLYRHCDAIMCVSQYTRDRLLSWSSLDAERVHVLPNSVDPAYAANRSAASLGYRYVLYVGNHRSYKNLDRLVQAYGRSRLREENVHLVLTGNCSPSLRAVIDRLGIDINVHFLGRVPEGDLPKIYRGATAVAYVSLCEGFGLPILEAMASDTPVVTSNVSSMPEVAGDAALLVDPLSVEAISTALDRIVLDTPLRRKLVRHGRERVQRFQWDESARTFWDVIARLARQERTGARRP